MKEIVILQNGEIFTGMIKDEYAVRCSCIDMCIKILRLGGFVCKEANVVLRDFTTIEVHGAVGVSGYKESDVRMFRVQGYYNRDYIFFTLDFDFLSLNIVTHHHDVNDDVFRRLKETQC